MGTSGVPWAATKAQIIKQIKADKGRITHVARAMNVDYTTIRKRIDADPELQQLVSDERNAFSETLLDGSEDTLLYALDNKRKDINAALKASFFALNNKGKERGYSAGNFYDQKTLNLSDFEEWAKNKKTLSQ